MITIDDPDLEAMLRVIEEETGEPPTAVLRRAMARALAGRRDAVVRDRPATEAADDVSPLEHSSEAAEANGAERPSVWALLAEMAGSVDMPPDWSEEHDHYIHGVPKRNPDA